FGDVIKAQGGDRRVIEDDSILAKADRTHSVTSDRPGILIRANARKIGVAAMRLGAGRERKEDTIDPGVGITLEAKPGDPVEQGQPLATLRYRHPARLQEALRVLDDAFAVEDEGEPTPLIFDRIS
ncbi:MAG: thymidine phosphorylase, partial [Acidimicrobiia bacterium]